MTRKKYDDWPPENIGSGSPIEDNFFIKEKKEIIYENIYKNIIDYEDDSMSALFNSASSGSKYTAKRLSSKSKPKSKPKKLTEAEKLRAENARLRREQQDALNHSETLRKLAKENGFEITEGNNGTELSVSMTSYDLLNQEQIFEVVKLINPRHMGDIVEWGKRIERTTADKQSGLMRRDIRDIELPSNDAITMAVQEIKDAVKQKQDEIKKPWALSKLFSFLSFLPKSTSTALAVTETRIDKFKGAIDQLEILRNGMQSDVDFCNDQLNHYGDVREGYHPYGSSLKWHIDALKDIKKHLIQSQQGDNKSEYGYRPEDHEAQRLRVDERVDELSLASDRYAGGFLQLDMAVELVSQNRHNIKSSMDSMIDRTITQFNALMGIEQKIVEMRAQAAADQSKATALQNAMARLKQEEKTIEGNIVQSMDDIQDKVDVFDITTRKLLDGEIDDAKRLMESKRQQLLLVAPSQEELTR